MRRLVHLSLGALVILMSSCAGSSDTNTPVTLATTSAEPNTTLSSANVARPTSPATTSLTTTTLAAGAPLQVTTIAQVTTTTGAGSIPALDSLAVLVVIDEHVGGYDRDAWSHWDQLDAGCSVRARVLIDESLTFAQVDPYGCAVVAGDWYSPYDGLTLSDPAEIDIDHVVPLAEAHRSGGHAWDDDRRRMYANDLSDPDHLIAVTAAANRTKGDSDPFDWLPQTSDRCRYVTAWIEVKVRWELSIDELERDAIAAVLETCAQAPANPVAPVPTTAPPYRPQTSTTLLPARGEDPQFGTCKDALAGGFGPYVRGSDIEYGWYRDGDGDGVVCEK